MSWQLQDPRPYTEQPGPPIQRRGSGRCLGLRLSKACREACREACQAGRRAALPVCPPLSASVRLCPPLSPLLSLLESTWHIPCYIETASRVAAPGAWRHSQRSALLRPASRPLAPSDGPDSSGLRPAVLLRAPARFCVSARQL